MRFIQTVILGIFLSASSAAIAEDLRGPFNNAPMETKGMWYLDSREDGVYAMFSEGFETVKGPNLHVYLSKLAAADANGAQAEGDLHVTALKSYKGGQLYKLPQGVNLADYNSFVIVCDKFHKLWAAGDLRPSQTS